MPALSARRRLDCLLITYIEALGARPAGMSPKDVVQPRMLALCNWSDWLHGAAGTDLVLADGCRGARLLMQTFANALVRQCAGGRARMWASGGLARRLGGCDMSTPMLA